MSGKLEMHGLCPRCNVTTAWGVREGWAFHTYTKHWRCTVCRVVTQPHLYLPDGLVQRIRKYEEAMRVVEVEISL